MLIPALNNETTIGGIAIDSSDNIYMNSAFSYTSSVET